MLNLQDFIEYTGTCDSASATSALSQAEGFAFSILWDRSEREDTEIYDGNGENYFQLKRYPIISIASLQFDGVVVDPTSYYPNSATWEIRMYTPFPRGFNVLSVQYTAGWTAETIPSDVKFAIYDIARAYLSAGSSLGSNVVRETIDGASIEWKDLPISEPTAILKSYSNIYV